MKNSHFFQRRGYTSFFIFSLFILFSNTAYLQVSNYAFTETTGTYQAILGNAALGGWSGTANGTDNPPGSTTPTHMILPFDFCMGGQSFPSGTRISMDYNGWIAFGNPSISAVTRQAPLTHINNSISAFGVGLQTTGSSNLSIRIFGTSPNRVIVFQWGGRFFGDATLNGTYRGHNYWRRVVNGHNNDYLHFQIRLYETTNVIEFHYLIGNPRTSSSGTLTSNVQVGLRGASATDYNARQKTTTGTIWNNNSSSATALPSGSTNTMNFNNQRNIAFNKPAYVTPANRGDLTATAGPGTGTIFRWTPVGVIGSNMDEVGCFTASPLPVELTGFDLVVDENSNRIFWTTASEQNSNYFEVERSLNGAEWDVVGRVQSAGNSSSTLHYELEDRGFERTINYYRLKQVDFDGTTKTYKIISADNRNLNKELIKIVNTMGQEVNQYYKGVVIEVYADGSNRRFYRN